MWLHSVFVSSRSLKYYIIFKNNPRVPRAAAARCALAAGKKTRRIPVLDPVHAARAAHT